MNISKRFQKFVLGGALALGLFVTVQTARSFPSDLPDVWITAPDPNAAETGPDTGTFRVWRNGGDLSLPLWVRLQCPPYGTAGCWEDYYDMGQWVEIPAWQNFVDLTLTPKLDSDCDEGDETVEQWLGDPTEYYRVIWPDNATVTIADALAPFITTPLTNQVVCPGDSTTFTVAVTGTGPFTYQWRFSPTWQWYYSSTPLTGQTAATLVIPNASPADMGWYWVRVTSDCGTAFSSAKLWGAADSDGDGVPDCIGVDSDHYDHDPLVFTITAPAESSCF